MTPPPLELFWIAGSPFAWRVMLTLEAKQIPYTPILLQGSQRDHKKPDFLALNPRGKVPTLRDGNFIVYESIAIMQYLEMKHPDRPMFGRAAYEGAAIWRSISEFTSYLQPSLERVYTPLLTGKSQEKSSDLERLVRASDMDWTIVRPTRLTETSAPSGYIFSANSRPSGAASMGRIDLAGFLVEEAEQARFKRALVGVTSR
jgi:glutathione S-transferase